MLTERARSIMLWLVPLGLFIGATVWAMRGDAWAALVNGACAGFCLGIAVFTWAHRRPQW